MVPTLVYYFSVLVLFNPPVGFLVPVKGTLDGDISGIIMSWKAYKALYTAKMV